MLGGSLLVALSFVVLWAGGTWSLLAVALGVLLIDIGMNGALIANQTRAYALVPGARGRINTVLFTTLFVFGALGAYAGSQAFLLVGWRGRLRGRARLLGAGRARGGPRPDPHRLAGAVYLSTRDRRHQAALSAGRPKRRRSGRPAKRRTAMPACARAAGTGPGRPAKSAVRNRHGAADDRSRRPGRSSGRGGAASAAARPARPPRARPHPPGPRARSPGPAPTPPRDRAPRRSGAAVPGSATAKPRRRPASP